MQSIWRCGAAGVFLLIVGPIMTRAEAPGRSALESPAKPLPVEVASLESAKESPGRAVPDGSVGGQLPAEKPVPAMQVVPLPYDQASFQYLGRELTRYHFGPGLQRPFLYPVAGPEGRSLTRMGHPRDPFGHSHHNSIWISHADVGGVNFWADRDKTPPGRIVCQRIEQYEDGERSAWFLALNVWQDGQGKAVLLERRRIEVQLVDREHWWILIDMELAPPDRGPVTIGQSPFGMIGVRMAKTIGVADGGGRLLNSEGQLGEPAMFRKPARWVDYSGPILPVSPPSVESKSPPSAADPKQPTTGPAGQSTAPGEKRSPELTKYCAGITLMDHPANPGHPTPFHVRSDGWMGASLTLAGPITIQPGQPLRLRYGLWIHPGVPAQAQIDAQWQQFAKSPLPAIPPRKM
ncbi:MAG TPA: PmoA family protein [Thermoguttaceae bacterium]|nr:PmoA family protein [Thermoguttaceae bacterium]